ncbi:PCYCGC motif-containing (lipo)protein [Aciduricibacillus chroicocephali]|uniref:PCYCGC motif-containing (Lipo)protein n=1 Tax=Aciduricibacillus chroicocephali TaxID=3054939 RepID=A0ABY9KU78_9BACI|nr:PCYCGC motif-containing (lipo)protein [Bacillaceae bacterium 44XB]
MKKTILSIGFCTMILLSACANESSAPGGPSEPQQKDNEPKITQHGGDIREETSNIKTLPTFLNSKPENMQNIYAAAGQHKELLEQMPCYCGCGESAGHKDNYDCFVHENENNGKVVWDDHGTKCQVCLEIAAEAITESQNGKSDAEIRKAIDEKYKEGYAEPTPTPAVS